MDRSAASDHVGEALALLNRCRNDEQRALDSLALAVLRERERGATVRSLADYYGVAPSAIHTWTQRGRTLKSGSPSRAPRHRDAASVNVIPTPIQWAILAAVLVCITLNVVEMLGQIHGWF
jgi:hypothetical protein